MGDRIVVMSAAVVQQIGTPAEVYHNPANLFVANFIGSPRHEPDQGEVRGRRRASAGREQVPGARRVEDRRWRSGLTGDEVILGFRPEAARRADGRAR